MDFSKRILLDPTTYGAAVATYESARLDWASSQVFFRNGFVEQNPRFTMSGLPRDVPVSYATGHRTIVGDAFSVLKSSVIHNIASQALEQMLVARFPRHRKLVKTIGWMERISVASVRSYRLSAGHFRQWRSNERRARELGLE